MAVAATTAGQLTREQVAQILTQPLQARSVFLAAGPRVFDTDGSPVRVPAAPSSVAENLEWVGENTQIPEADPDFDETDRKSTRLNSSHVAISYAVFCLKKKTITQPRTE